MPAFVRTAAPILLALGLCACATPCKDDGLGQKHCPAGSATESEVTGGSSSISETGSASASSETASGSASQSGSGESETSGSEGGTSAGATTDGASATDAESSGSGTGTGESTSGGPGDCDDGAKNGDETDVDCGGSCPPCEDGDDCLVEGDCINMMCVEQVCGDPVCKDAVDDNGCQACIKSSCCDRLATCFADPYCVCWFECIEKSNDFEPCRLECMGTNGVGDVTSCVNSRCKDPSACG